jgi:Na+/pantothenate symporter
VPLMMGFWHKGPKNKASGVASMWAGLLTAAIFYSGDKFFNIEWMASIEPLYPGITLSLLAFLWVNRTAKERV